MKTQKEIKAKIEELLSMDMDSSVSKEDLLVLMSWISALRWVLSKNA